MDVFLLPKSRLNVCPNLDELKRRLAEKIVVLAHESLNDRGRFMIALSGGSTPKHLYELLTHEEFRDNLPWEHTHVFWGDERCVAHDDPQSNFKMSNDALLSKIAIPPVNVHATKGQDKDSEKCAQEYEETIKTVFGVKDKEVPIFDLNLLGLGPEGHTASIFPDSPVFEETHKLVMSVWVEKLKAQRITFTLPLINAARNVIFMVSGEEKADILAAVLEDEKPTLPAQFIAPVNGSLEWYVDEEAASKVNRQVLS